MTVEVVAYEHRIEYGHDAYGNRFPRLSLEVARSDRPERTVDVDAHLDSGADRSLISGKLGMAIGINVLEGPQLIFQSTIGTELVATLHPVTLTHPELGAFRLEVGFSTTDIRRNLLGRDFFNLAQIGFRERQLAVFLTASP